MKPVVDVSAVERPSPVVSQITLAEFLTLVRGEDSCPDVGRLAIFGHDHMRRHGSISFLFAAYQTVLGREPDSSILAAWGGEGMSLSEIESMLDQMLESDEFKSRAVQGIPGPFQSRFKFDRALLI